MLTSEEDYEWRKMSGNPFTTRIDRLCEEKGVHFYWVVQTIAKELKLNRTESAGLMWNYLSCFRYRSCDEGAE